jgi:cytochrome P450
MKAYRVGKWRSLPELARFWTNPVGALRKLHRRHGLFVQLELPRSTREKPSALNIVASEELYKELLSDTETWRNVKISPRLRRNDATDRLTNGMTRLRGVRHEHYRKLIAPPLKRAAVAGMGPDMARIADAQVRAWPRETPVSLPELCRDLAKRLAIGLLFGDDMDRALPITEMISRMIDAAWPIPGIAYFRWVREAGEQERAILEWAEEKRGRHDASDLLSILVNNTDEKGEPPSAEILGGITSFVFAAAYDTCQNGLAWTLLLLTQHPAIMQSVTEEVIGALAGELPTMDRVGGLPLFDAVIKEGMRLLPPVPLVIRRATRQTTLGEEPIGNSERVIVSTFIINRNPDIYSDADRFDPGRWAKIRPTPFQYTVFGAGGHMCPGITFGLQMMKIGLAAILSQHRVELAPGSNVGYRTHVTLAPHGRVEVIFRRPQDKSIYRPMVGPVRGLLTLPQLA